MRSIDILYGPNGNSPWQTPLHGLPTLAHTSDLRAGQKLSQRYHSPHSDLIIADDPKVFALMDAYIANGT